MLFYIAPLVWTSAWLRWILLSPLFRAVDVIYTLFTFLDRMQMPRASARAIALAIVHYFEFVVIFSCAYVATFRSADCGCLLGTYGGIQGLFPSEFFYFSITTAATVGYGDVRLNPIPGCGLTR